MCRLETIPTVLGWLWAWREHVSGEYVLGIQLMVAAAVSWVMVLVSLGGKGLAASPGKILGRGLPGKILSVHMSTLTVLVRN